MKGESFWHSVDDRGGEQWGNQVTECRDTSWSSWTNGAGTLAGGCGVRNENPHCFLGKLCFPFVPRTQRDHIKKPSISLTSFWDILGENQALPECLSLDSVCYFSRIKWNDQTWALSQMVCTKVSKHLTTPTKWWAPIPAVQEMQGS